MSSSHHPPPKRPCHGPMTHDVWTYNPLSPWLDVASTQEALNWLLQSSREWTPEQVRLIREWTQCQHPSQSFRLGAAVVSFTGMVTQSPSPWNPLEDLYQSPFQCKSCGWIFLDQDTLMTHVNEHFFVNKAWSNTSLHVAQTRLWGGQEEEDQNLIPNQPVITPTSPCWQDMCVAEACGSCTQEPQCQHCFESLPVLLDHDHADIHGPAVQKGVNLASKGHAPLHFLSSQPPCCQELLTTSLQQVPVSCCYYLCADCWLRSLVFPCTVCGAKRPR